MAESITVRAVREFMCSGEVHNVATRAEVHVRKGFAKYARALSEASRGTVGQPHETPDETRLMGNALVHFLKLREYVQAHQPNGRENVFQLSTFWWILESEERVLRGISQREAHKFFRSIRRVKRLIKCFHGQPWHLLPFTTPLAEGCASEIRKLQRFVENRLLSS